MPYKVDVLCKYRPLHKAVIYKMQDFRIPTVLHPIGDKILLVYGGVDVWVDLESTSVRIERGGDSQSTYIEIGDPNAVNNIIELIDV